MLRRHANVKRVKFRGILHLQNISPGLRVDARRSAVTSYVPERFCRKAEYRSVTQRSVFVYARRVSIRHDLRKPFCHPRQYVGRYSGDPEQDAHRTRCGGMQRSRCACISASTQIRVRQLWCTRALVGNSAVPVNYAMCLYIKSLVPDDAISVYYLLVKHFTHAQPQFGLCLNQVRLE